MPVRFGLDVYSLRSQGWTPLQHLDYCASRGIRVVHFSEVRLLGGLAPDHLQRVRDAARERDIDVEIGMRSICPGAEIFDATQGPADLQLARMLDAARTVGSPLVRCVLGRFDDRSGPGGIEARIGETIKVLRAVRSRVLDAGLKIALENHAGDLQARELKELVEAAGPDFVGVCFDSGNALWALEDPHTALDTLAPYVLTSHIRDGAVWKTPEGAAVAWTRFGEGQVGIADLLRDYARKCPGRALSLEVIVSDAPRVLAYRDPRFWDAYRRMPAWEFARFLALVEHGRPVERRPALPGESPAARELADVDASLSQLLTSNF